MTLFFFSHSKELLRKFKDELFLPYLRGTLRQDINSKWQIFPLARNRKDKGKPLSMCGYVFYESYILLRRDLKNNFKKAVIKFKESHPDIMKRKDNLSKDDKKVIRISLAPYIGWISQTNSKELFRRYLGIPFFKIKN